MDITPDISQIDPSAFAQPQPAPQATTGDDLAKLLQLVQSQQQGQQAPRGQEQLLQSLASQGMTRGLGGETPMGTPQPTFSGPVAGYAGPLRASDRPMETPVPTLPFGQAQALQGQEVARRTQLPGGRNLGQVSDIMQMLGKLPKEVAGPLFQALGVLPQGVMGKPVTPQVFSKMMKFNPDTMEFDAPGADLADASSTDLMKQGYKMYSEPQMRAVNEIKDTNVAFQQLRSAVQDIKGKSAPELLASQYTSGNVGGPEGAIFKKATTNFTSIFDKFLGGTRGAASPMMQQVRAKVLPTIFSTGEVSDRLMTDLDSLIKTMGENRVKSVIGGTAYDTAAQDKQAAKVLNTWAKDQSAAPAPRQSGALPGQAQSAIPAGRVPVLNPQGKPVTLPANQVKAALAAGYKPYQQ